jgi:hypothetical protein
MQTSDEITIDNTPWRDEGACMNNKYSVLTLWEVEGGKSTTREK